MTETQAIEVANRATDVILGCQRTIMEAKVMIREALEDIKDPAARKMLLYIVDKG